MGPNELIKMSKLILVGPSGRMLTRKCTDHRCPTSEVRPNLCIVIQQQSVQNTCYLMRSSRCSCRIIIFQCIVLGEMRTVYHKHNYKPYCPANNRRGHVCVCVFFVTETRTKRVTQVLVPGSRCENRSDVECCSRDLASSSTENECRLTRKMITCMEGSRNALSIHLLCQHERDTDHLIKYLCSLIVGSAAHSIN